MRTNLRSFSFVVLHADGSRRTSHAWNAPTWFLARAAVAKHYGVDPCDVRPATRKVMAKEVGT